MKFACMKLESLVITDQNAVVNTFPGLVHTARHAMEVGSTQRHRLFGAMSKVRLATGAKS
jgi:hypothetical protein